MREHLPRIAGIAAGALLVGALLGAGLGRADAGSARRYGEVAEESRARQLEARLAEVGADRDRLRQENDALGAQLRAAAPAVDVGGAVTRLEQEAQALRRELEAGRDQARAALARAEKELAGAKAQVRDLRAEAARWRQEATDARGQVETLRRELATLNETLKLFQRR